MFRSLSKKESKINKLQFKNTMKKYDSKKDKIQSLKCSNKKAKNQHPVVSAVFEKHTFFSLSVVCIQCITAYAISLVVMEPLQEALRFLLV